MTFVEYKFEGSNYDDRKVFARDDCDTDEDEDWNENTGRRPDTGKKVDVA